MARYTIQTKQIDDFWVGSGKCEARSKKAATELAQAEMGKWFAPKRAVNMDTGEVVAEFAPNWWEEHAAACRAKLAEMDAADAQANGTADYGIKMQDKTGRTFVLSINGACIDELITTGLSAAHAKEEVESNQFGNAIARGDIGDDAWVI